MGGFRRADAAITHQQDQVNINTGMFHIVLVGFGYF